MIESIRSAVAGQYGAGLSMLGICLEHADEATWHAPVGQSPFWHVAYHAMFYTDLYLTRDEASFVPQPFHRENENLVVRPGTPEAESVADVPYGRDLLSGYLETCGAKVTAIMEQETGETLMGASGFSWHAFSRLELHLYNIRHLQHHTGQLGAALRSRQGVGARWVGTKRL